MPCSGPCYRPPGGGCGRGFSVFRRGDTGSLAERREAGLQNGMIIVVDSVTCMQVSGWARDRQSPHERVALTLGNAQGMALQAVADRVWKPFVHLGGSVCHCGFTFDLRAAVMPEAASSFDLIATTRQGRGHQVLRDVPGRPLAGTTVDYGKAASAAWLTRLGPYRLAFAGPVQSLRLHSSAVHGAGDARLLGAVVCNVRVNGAALDMRDGGSFVGFHDVEG